MFNNTVVLSTPNGSSATRSLSLNGTNAGKSVRRFSVSNTEYIQLSIVSSLTTENKPYVTTRTLIRIDHVSYDAVALVWVTASSYIVKTIPSGVLTDAAMQDTTFALAQFLFDPDLITGNASTSIHTPTASALNSTLLRLASGEI